MPLASTTLTAKNPPIMLFRFLKVGSRIDLPRVVVLIQSRSLQSLVRRLQVDCTAGLTHEGTMTTDAAALLLPWLWV